MAKAKQTYIYEKVKMMTEKVCHNYDVFVIILTFMSFISFHFLI